MVRDLEHLDDLAQSRCAAGLPFVDRPTAALYMWFYATTAQTAYFGYGCFVALLSSGYVVHTAGLARLLSPLPSRGWRAHATQPMDALRLHAYERPSRWSHVRQHIACGVRAAREPHANLVIIAVRSLKFFLCSFFTCTTPDPGAHTTRTATARTHTACVSVSLCHDT